jgi:hypothetical protein
MPSRGANVNPFSPTTKLNLILFLNHQNFQKINHFMILIMSSVWGSDGGFLFIFHVLCLN